MASLHSDAMEVIISYYFDNGALFSILRPLFCEHFSVRFSILFNVRKANQIKSTMKTKHLMTLFSQIEGQKRKGQGVSEYFVNKVHKVL